MYSPNPLFNLCARRGWPVNATTRPLYPRGSVSVSILPEDINRCTGVAFRCTLEHCSIIAFEACEFNLTSLHIRVSKY
jgi:hypothetical protein